MDLDVYARQVHEQLLGAAVLGDERVREIAGTLATAAAPAVRLAILGALAAAADEITAALLDSPDAPVIAVQLDTDDIRIAVTTSPAEPAGSARLDDGDASARISLRLPESLKAEIDAAAARTGVSVNTWLVRAATTALGSASNKRVTNTHHVTGWING